MFPEGLEVITFLSSTILLSAAIYYLLNELKIFNFHKINIIIAIGISIPTMILLPFLSPIIGSVSIFLIFLKNSKKKNRMHLGIILSIIYFIVAMMVTFFV